MNHSRSNRLQNKDSKLRNACCNIYQHVKVVIMAAVKGLYRVYTLLKNKATERQNATIQTRENYNTKHGLDLYSVSLNI